MRWLPVLALLLCIGLLPAVGRADENASPKGAAPPTALLDLSRRDLLFAATAGAGVGALAAVIGGNSLLAGGAGVIVVVYVAHMVAEVIAVSGMLYLWPDEEETDPFERAGTAARHHERPLIHGQLDFSALTGSGRAADASLRMIDSAASPGD